MELPEPAYDVAIVGAGPVGLYLALRMAQRGHSVVVLERQPAPYRLPRAVHFDDEVARLLAQAGLVGELHGIIEQGDTYDWRNADGKTLLAFHWPGAGPSGWPRMNMFSQPQLEALLEAKVTASPLITVRRGKAVTTLETGAEGVTLTCRDQPQGQEQEQGQRHHVQARFVVGCDGARSVVREHLGTTITDLGFYFDWLVVDLVPYEDRRWSPVNIQLCDPKRPTSAVSGGPGRRRFEFMRMPDEAIEDLEREGTAWELLKPWGYTPDNAVLERSAVYTFQARWADTWYARRVAIAGDAAHLMPPFAGQGLCSGIRDAANLAWKLDLVLRGLATDELLATYTTERSVHIKNAIDESVALGNVICLTDPAAAAQRDEFMLAVGTDPAKLLPPISPAKLGPGVLDPAGGPEAGTVAPQPMVRTPDGAEGLWDQVVGSGFAIVSSLSAAEALDNRRRAALDRFGVRWVQLVPEAESVPPEAVIDADGTVLAHLARAGPGDGYAAVAIRPDAYLYGTAATAGAIPAFTDDLLRRLAGASPRRSRSTRPADGSPDTAEAHR